MRRRLALLAVTALLQASPAALADHIDPYALAEKAAKAYQENDSYPEVRALFSEGLREARHDGRLDPGFAIIYAMYSDIARYDGDPAFALQLADEGLQLTLTEVPPDEDMRNTLLVSRAYALADLGRYQDAVESVAITALWMGQRFGDKARADLEDKAKGWAAQAAAQSDGAGDYPSAVQLAIDLIGQADEALNKRDTRAALALAARAALPEDANLPEADVSFMNARVHTVSAQAYSYEGRQNLAYVALMRAADLLVTQPWDGKSKPRLRPEVAREEGWRLLAWMTFSHLAAAASAVREEAVAQAAIDAASPLAKGPEDRFSLLVQQAGLSFFIKDYAKAIEVFSASRQEALSVGDDKNAALAGLYVAIAKLSAAPWENSENELQMLLKAAGDAADVMADDPQIVEYMLTTAVRTAYANTGSMEAALPVARRAFDVFRERQKAMAGYEAVQETGRRERRRFLEMLIAGEYEAARKGN